MNRKQRRLVRRLKRASGRLSVSSKERQAINTVCASPAKLDMLQAQMELARLNPYEGSDRLVGMDWRSVISNLWDWFKANWPAILKMILTIAPLLLDETREDINARFDKMEKEGTLDLDIVVKPGGEVCKPYRDSITERKT